MNKIGYPILILVFFLSCESNNSDSESPNKLETTTEIEKPKNLTKKDKEESKDTIPKIYSKTNKRTKVKSVLSLLNGDKHGLCKQYYPSGKIWKESMYKHNQMDGVAKIFYESGQLKKEVDYSLGKKNGKFLEYYKSGNIKTEIQYDMDLPLPGFKEINYLKKKVEQPKIKVRHEDRLFEGVYNLYFSIDPKFSKVKMYAIDKEEDWNSEYGVQYYSLKETPNNEFKLEIFLSEGFYYVNEINVYASYKTKMKNEVVVHKKVNLALSND